jgi:DNA polymerase-2
MNSFFGVLASPNCRYFDLRMANAITNFGQDIIKLTASEIENQGYQVIYSDTDSVFVHTKLEKEKAEKLGAQISSHIDNFYNKYVKENYNRKSYLDLEFDKLFLALIMPRLRVKEKTNETQENKDQESKGAKKRYAGLVEEEINNKKQEVLEITGLEAIRGDWTEAAQEFQKELLMKVLKNENPSSFIKSFIKDLRAGKIDKKLIYRKSIRKELKDYTKTTPPHVKAARLLDTIESNVIEYYITTNGPEPIQKLKHKLDYEHYIEKQIEPIARTILETIGIEFKNLLEGSKQKTLF